MITVKVEVKLYHSLYDQAESKQTVSEVNVLIGLKFVLVCISCSELFQTVSNQIKACIAINI